MASVFLLIADPKLELTRKALQSALEGAEKVSLFDSGAPTHIHRGPDRPS